MTRRSDARREESRRKKTIRKQPVSLSHLSQCASTPTSRPDTYRGLKKGRRRPCSMTNGTDNDDELSDDDITTLERAEAYWLSDDRDEL
jgi:hypothetical protein